MSNQYTPVEGVKVVANPWEEGFYVSPETENASFPGWSAEEVKEWANAVEWAENEDKAVESWAQYEASVEGIDARLGNEYEEALAKFQKLAGPVAVGDTVDRR